MLPPLLGTFEWPRKLPEKMRQRNIAQGKVLSNLWTELLGNKGTKAFPAVFSEPKFLKALTDAAFDVVGYKDDINLYFHLFPEMIGMMHSNLQSDNAYYWYDSEGRLDCGIIDWGGLSPAHICPRLTGCITSCLGEVLDEHEDGLLMCFRNEYWKECGLQIDFHELKRQWELSIMTYLYSMGMNIEAEIFRQCPKEEWDTITTLMDDRVAGMWNCRCYVFMIYHALKYLHIRWRRGGEGRLHCHDSFLQWKEVWLERGME